MINEDFNTELKYYEKFFNINTTVDKVTMAPVFIFTCKLTFEIFTFKVSFVDIQDYGKNHNIFKELKLIIRNKNLNDLLN